MISDSDLQLLNTYLDGALSPAERMALEARLTTDAILGRELETLRATRSLLRGLPTLRAPRNFTLTPAMVRPSQATRVFQLTQSVWVGGLSAAASVLLIVLGLALVRTAGNPAPNSVVNVAAPASTFAVQPLEAAALPTQSMTGARLPTTPAAFPTLTFDPAMADIAASMPLASPEGVLGSVLVTMSAESMADTGLFESAPAETPFTLQGGADSAPAGAPAVDGLSAAIVLFTMTPNAKTFSPTPAPTQTLESQAYSFMAPVPPVEGTPTAQLESAAGLANQSGASSTATRPDDQPELEAAMALRLLPTATDPLPLPTMRRTQTSAPTLERALGDALAQMPTPTMTTATIVAAPSASTLAEEPSASLAGTVLLGMGGVLGVLAVIILLRASRRR